MADKRDLTLDIAKAICIILMVVGHSGCPSYLFDVIYMFHMPCFFFISGWLLSEKYITDIKTGLKQKTKGSYVPFVEWTLIFILLHNFFTRLYIYEDSYSLKIFVERIIRAITLTGGESLLGGFWFLISLFWASVITLVIYHALNRRSKLTVYNIMGGGMLMLVIASSLKPLSVKLPQQFMEQTFLATSFYMTGFLYKKEFANKINRNLGLVLLLVPIIAAVFFQWGMFNNKGLMVFPYYLVATAGTIGVISLSSLLKECKISVLLAYIGNKTLYILIFHFLAFRAVSYIYIRLNNLPIEYMSQRPVLQETNDWLWIIYSIAGTVLSLIMWEIFHLPVWSIKLKK